MISRFKSALLNAVSNTGLDASVVGLGGNNSRSGGEENSPGSTSGTGGRRSSRHGQGQGFDQNGETKLVKYEYSRPHFIQLVSADEIVVSADHAVRPIIVPRDLSFLPWESGYAETINSGKSKLNEDQARVHLSSIRVVIQEEVKRRSVEINGQPVETPTEPPPSQEFEIPYCFFGLFDGHAGAGAAVAAAASLHLILHEKLQQIGEHLVNDGPFCESIGTGKGKGKGVFWFPQMSVTRDSLIVGALEAAFHEMDENIRSDNLKYDGVNGGCTAVICLFILGKVYTANAGDSRAIYCMRNSDPVPLSQDFTPESERTRVRLLAAQRPELLGADFTANEYLRRPTKKDLGSNILYRSGHMTGWTYKTCCIDDLKFPVVFGHGKRSRVLATIGVTRGFGDHELCAHSSNTRIKPFLTCQPEVKILDLTDNLDEDSVIVMGTDGLWDVTANGTASRTVFSTLDQFPPTDKSRHKYRYVSAAQDLVMHARGKFNDRNWKMNDGSAATIDDISVFVVPIGPYRKECMEKTRLDVQNRSLPADVGLKPETNGLDLENHEISLISDTTSVINLANTNGTTTNLEEEEPNN